MNAGRASLCCDYHVAAGSFCIRVTSVYILLLDIDDCRSAVKLVVSHCVWNPLGIPSVLVVHSRDAYQNIAGDIADASKVMQRTFILSPKRTNWLKTTDSHWMVLLSSVFAHCSEKRGFFIYRNSNHHCQWYLSNGSFAAEIAWKFDRYSLFRLTIQSTRSTRTPRCRLFVRRHGVISCSWQGHFQPEVVRLVQGYENCIVRYFRTFNVPQGIM
jgi:hypothetical protein